jgi:hypothetical protein
MLNSEEKRSLIEWRERNPVRAPSVLTTCAAALTILGAVALFGAESEVRGEAGSARPYPYPALNASLSHGQALYIARQQQFMSSQNPAKSVIPPMAQANPRIGDGRDLGEE